MKKLLIIVSVVLTLTMAGSIFADDIHHDPAKIRPAKKEYSPYLNHNYPDRVFWGDTHLHTAYSTDAGLFGCTVGPDEAYRFAKGEIVTSSTGVRTRLLRPLDFLVVADHAENLGLAPMIAESNSGLLQVEWGKEIHDATKAGDLVKAYNMWASRLTKRDDPLTGYEDLTRSMWERITTAGEKHNEPGKFTAFLGYEWTSVPGGSNLQQLYRGTTAFRLLERP